jgi:hypothetical protein
MRAGMRAAWQVLWGVNGDSDGLRLCEVPKCQGDQSCLIDSDLHHLYNGVS